MESKIIFELFGIKENERKVRGQKVVYLLNDIITPINKMKILLYISKIYYYIISKSDYFLFKKKKKKNIKN
jgi:hypothetical protein